jgi:hypothetical protein
MYTLDRGHAEEEHESLEEPAQTEETANTDLTEGKLRCIPPIFLDFCSSIKIYITVWLYIKFT